MKTYQVILGGRGAELYLHSITEEKKQLLNWSNINLKQHFAYRDRYNVVENIPNSIFKFSVVRNPFSRTYSYYLHFNKINRTTIDFYSFLNFCILSLN